MQGSSAGPESLYLEEPNVELSARVAFQFFLSCYCRSRLRSRLSRAISLSILSQLLRRKEDEGV